MKSDLYNEKDEEILALSLQDPRVFEKLVDRYQEPFLKKAKAIIGNDYAQDCVQEAFVKMYLHAPKFEKRVGASLSSWAYKILINTCLTHYKKHKKELGSVSLDETMVEGNLEPVEESYTDQFLRIASKIPTKTAILLKSLVIDGKHPKALAAEEGISYEAMRVRIHRAKQEFKKAL